MRVAVMVISLVLMLVIVFQSLASALGGGLSSNAADKAGFSEGAVAGFCVAFLFLLGDAFAIGLPRTATVMFLIAGIVGLAAGGSTKYHDLSVWGVIALALSVMSFIGWRGKRRAQIKERARDEQMTRLLAERDSPAP